MKEKPSTIWIKPSTKKLLDKLGDKGDSYENIILSLIAKQNTPKIPLEIDGIKLYRQGVEARPFFVGIPYNALFEMAGRKTTFSYWIGKKNRGYWDYNGSTEIAKQIIDEHIKGKKSIKEIIKEWEDIVQVQKEIEQEIKELDQKENQEINDLFRRLVKQILASWNISITIEIFDPDSESLIIDVLNRYDKSNLTQKEFKVLCTPPILTCIQKELISRYEIGTKKEDHKLEEHTKKFFWIKNTWADVYFIDKNYFREKIARLEREEINFKSKIKETQDNLKKLEQDKKAILEKKKLSVEVKKTIEFFELMTKWREDRKECALISNHYLYLLLQEMAKRINVEPKKLLFASVHELKVPLSETYLKELEEREKGCLQFHDETGERFLTGKIVDEFIKNVNQQYCKFAERLYGNVANPGEVTGQARIIFTTDDLHKMQKGDILVSPCTRPEYVSAMEKASAILTDEGGITSHAAIVSRELGVPCIVGLQNATDVIKDGDKLIVNANHGVVTIKK